MKPRPKAKTDPSQFVGQRVAKFFDGDDDDEGQQLFLGTVDKALRGGVLWHVKYDDGDQEDLNLGELQRAMQLFKKEQSEEKEGDAENNANMDVEADARNNADSDADDSNEVSFDDKSDYSEEDNVDYDWRKSNRKSQTTPTRSSQRTPPRKARKGRPPRRKYVGQRVAKFFKGDLFMGTVKKIVGKQGGLWLVKYDDGDQEDLDLDELSTAIQLYQKHKQEDEEADDDQQVKPATSPNSRSTRSRKRPPPREEEKVKMDSSTSRAKRAKQRGSPVGTKPQQKNPSEFIGRRVAKSFGQLFLGRVDEVLKSAGVQLWHVIYDDGDNEDFEWDELKDAIALYKQHYGEEESSDGEGEDVIDDEKKKPPRAERGVQMRKSSARQEKEQKKTTAKHDEGSKQKTAAIQEKSPRKTRSTQHEKKSDKKNNSEKKEECKQDPPSTRKRSERLLETTPTPEHDALSEKKPATIEKDSETNKHSQRKGMKKDAGKTHDQDDGSNNMVFVPSGAKKRTSGKVADQRKAPPHYFGQRVAKFFGDEDEALFFGTVDKVVKDGRNELWHVTYDDGDEEDLDWDELYEGLHLYREHQEETEAEEFAKEKDFDRKKSAVAAKKTKSTSQKDRVTPRKQDNDADAGSRRDSWKSPWAKSESGKLEWPIQGKTMVTPSSQKRKKRSSANDADKASDWLIYPLDD